MAEPWQHNESITVVRNESFVGTAGASEQIEFRIYSDLATSYRDYQARLARHRARPAARGVPGGARHVRRSVIQTPLAALNYIGLPVGRAPYDNLDFRKALSLSIDREALVDRVMQGSVEAAGSLRAAAGARSEPGAV